MHYYSTNNKSIKVSFREAVLKGLSNDGGLFMPVSVPSIKRSFIESIENKSFQEIALEIAKGFIHNEIKDSDFEGILRSIQVDGRNIIFPLKKAIIEKGEIKYLQ